ncbi:Heat shock factor (HSF)-type, DNA-binding protein [Corchorus capsularis]|uniref:Heat shock factor (HSF)-type, DNA-binding protein n=1 Tax=Corchorus capsularis TaxID=210143 RepID=A0A1R3JP87_COCAP|nr:Heat shock factor (HSF)-type, DNA-binding protein [Corchorus capsularis]
MDPTAASSGGGGGGGGPAPFLLKTYDMVDDSSTDEIVSWSSNKKSFVVWNPPEFARLLLPTYFKHNNFSSFIRQLNTYGFRKIDPERWEFANEDFVKDQKHLLKNIHRRKPIHSHSHPQGSLIDPERAGFEEEIEKLSREKATLEANVLRFRQERSAAKHLFEELTQQADQMERRQEILCNFLQKAVNDPTFVEHLVRKIESMDVAAYNKKRRLPQVDQIKPVGENSLLDNNGSSRPEFGNIFHQDFSNKLRLELSPAVSDINLVSNSTQSSSEDGASPQRRISEGEPKDVQPRPDGLLFAPEALDLSDTGTSFTFKMDSSFNQRVSINDSPTVHSMQQRLSSNEETDSHISCQLNLSLASSSLQVNRSPSLTRMSQLGQEIGKVSDSRSYANNKDSDTRRFENSKNMVDEEAALSSPKEGPNTNQAPAAPPVRVNDVFWEQFLTERPGSSDNEEASSSYRANPYEEQEDKRCKATQCNSSIGVSILELGHALKASEVDVMVRRVCSKKLEDCLKEQEMESESSRRVLVMQRRYISYETLRRDMVPCAKPGASYYDCNAGQANPYNRGCEVITRCARDIKDNKS